MWHKFLSLATFTYNIFCSPNLGNHSPYELMFGRKLKLLINLEINMDIQIFWHIQRLPYIVNQKVRLFTENITKLQNEAIGTLKQGQGIFPIQQQRFSLYNLPLNISV